MQAQATRWPFWFLIATLASFLLVTIPVVFGHPTVLTGDPRIYGESMEKLFSGQLPYIDFTFEHLPLAIVPMAVAHLLSVATGLPFVYPFMVLMLAMVFVTGVLVVRLADRLGLGAVGLRWVVMVAPMLLIIPYRIDALSVLLAVAAVWYAVQEREEWSLASALGAILSKGWPVVLAAADWWRERRVRAVALVGFTGLMGALLYLTEGFRAGRDFVGVHEETLSGTVIIVWRMALGNEPQIVDSAGALYVVTGGWAVLLNLAVGGAIALAALSVVRNRFSWPGGIALTGALTYGVLLASPLLSTQFMMWPIPFVALTGSRRGQILLTAVGVLSVALTGFWFPETLWWHSGWLIRNLLLVAAAVVAVIDVQSIAKAPLDEQQLVAGS